MEHTDILRRLYQRSPELTEELRKAHLEEFASSACELTPEEPEVSVTPEYLLINEHFRHVGQKYLRLITLTAMTGGSMYPCTRRMFCLLLALLALGEPAWAVDRGDDIVMQEAWIPMRDGVRLAADIYYPKGHEPGAGGAPLPVLLEYLPYRKTEDRASRLALFSYFIRQGYAVARVDIRGTGSSEGHLVQYEYSEQEQQDGDEIIAWLALQPWSTGKLGMFGLSWGGFNALHMAMRNPPALRAVVAIQAADDLYEDDAHFIDGGMHVDSYEMQLDLANAMPGAITASMRPTSVIVSTRRPGCRSTSNSPAPAPSGTAPRRSAISTASAFPPA